MAIGQTNVSMDDILYEKAGNPSKTPPLLNRKNISLYGLSVNGVADYQDASTSAEMEDKLNKLYNAILPLLSNLKANPEKDYIYWPNRTEKVEAFEDHIAGIIK